MLSPKVTVLMPVGGPQNEVYLRTAIRCMAQQSYDNLDLCVGDDGNTSATTVDILKQSVERWPDRVRVIRNTLDEHGSAYALDAALSIADEDTKYFSKADSDDIFHRDREANRVKTFGKLPDPQVSILYDDYFQLVYEPRPHVIPVILPPYDYRKYLDSSFIHGNAMFRSSVYERWGGPLKETFVYEGYSNPRGCNKHGEDLAHWLAVTDFADAFHMSADPAYTFTYRVYKSSKYMRDRKHVDYCRTYLQTRAKERRGLLSPNPP